MFVTMLVNLIRIDIVASNIVTNSAATIVTSSAASKNNKNLINVDHSRVMILMLMNMIMIMIIMNLS